MTDTEPTAEAPELTTLKDLLVDLSEDQASAEPSMSATQLIDSIDQHFEAVRKAEGCVFPARRICYRRGLCGVHLYCQVSRKA
jgi:hypothetical protein